MLASRWSGDSGYHEIGQIFQHVADRPGGQGGECPACRRRPAKRIRPRRFQRTVAGHDRQRLFQIALDLIALFDGALPKGALLRVGGNDGTRGWGEAGRNGANCTLIAKNQLLSGDIIVDGRKISGMKPDDVRKNILGNEIAYIPQAAMNALNPTQKIIRFVEDVIHAHDPKMPRKDIYDLAKERFQILGLPEEVLQKHAVELSGGMKQRTVIAISTILSPKVLIADEPSSALDVTSQKMVIKMMRDLMEKGFIKSMIFITHELPLLYNVTDDIMVMYAGQIVEKGTAKEMVFDPLHPYSKGLMGSIIVPEEGVREQKLTAIPGTPPNLKHPPEGCRFADRCPYAQPTCRGMKPEVIELPNGREYRCLMSERKVREVYANA